MGIILLLVIMGVLIWEAWKTRRRKKCQLKIKSVDINPGDTLITKCEGSEEWSFAIIWPINEKVPLVTGPANSFSSTYNLTILGIKKRRPK